MPKTRITVVGGGVAGISSACMLLRNIPECTVTVIAERFTPMTTSDVAAGMWGPFIMEGTPEERIHKWSSATWSELQKWHDDSPDWGVLKVPGRCLYDTEHHEPEFWSDIPLDYNTLNKEQCQEQGPQYTSGCSFTTLVAPPSKFLPKLMDEITAKGGKFVQRKLSTLSDACEDADLVVHCSGVMGKTLANDEEDMTASRGQVVRVKAPWVKTFIGDERSNALTYIIPCGDCVVLGGTVEVNNWNTTEDKETTEAILSRCRTLMPSLKEAVVIGSDAGLRPVRGAGVRLEREDILHGGRSVPVVHNYGHAGCGVTLMWGCAEEVTRIVEAIINSTPN